MRGLKESMQWEKRGGLEGWGWQQNEDCIRDGG